MSTQSNQKTRETVERHLKSSEYRSELSFCIIVFFGERIPNCDCWGLATELVCIVEVWWSICMYVLCSMYWSFRTHYTR